MGKGFNIFRIPFMMERLVPGSMTSGANAAYLADMKSIVSHITGKGGYAAICAMIRSMSSYEAINTIYGANYD